MRYSKPLIIIACILFFGQLSSTAQKRTFKKGQMDVGISIGLLPKFFADKRNVMLPPMSLSADYRIADKFSMGVYAGKSITETSPAIVRDGLIAQWKNNFTTLGLKGSVHFT